MLPRKCGLDSSPSAGKVISLIHHNLISSHHPPNSVFDVGLDTELVMSLRKPSRTDIRAADPTISLKAALLSFEDILTEEQKRQYQANTTKPDAASVIAFVADIDANNNNSTNRRCVAPRLCTFLEATQQFSSVVDTFVSSNPTLAALIWGGVKMAILTASNVAAYFDKVTSMIMAIGKSCPTYQKFGQLYPGCVGLQRALCDYYAIIVKLCIKIIEVSRRTAITQTLTAIFVPFESEFKPSLNEIDQATKEIQLQLSLASKQTLEETRKLLEHESENNKAFRRLTSKFQKETEKEHTEAKQLRIIQMEREAAKLKSSIRDNLSPVNHVKPWKQAMKQRVPSTAEWLQRESLFHQWKDDRGTAILWCSGTMGVGKTVLMSNVVAQLHVSRKANDIISYYFCRSDDAPTLSARNILGSLTRQILDSQIENAEHDSLRALEKDSRDLDTAKVVIDFLLSRLQVGKTYYLVLDGLDECNRGEIQMVAQSLAQLCDKHVSDFKILCAGRPELEKELWRVATPKYKIQVTERKVESDMDHYITIILGRCLEEGQLKLGDPKLIMPISKALQEGSKGM
jgi:Cdc6-like AAA superfamily ATPase